MLFKKENPAPAAMPAEAAEMQPEVVPNAAGNTENPFLEAANALIELQQAGKLPKGFDLEAACADPAFAALLKEFAPNAAVRIYDAEKRAASAYDDAIAAMTEQQQKRNALPKSTRPNRAVSPTPDYMSLSPAEFRALENRIKSAARSGKRITL